MHTGNTQDKGTFLSWHGQSCYWLCLHTAEMPSPVSISWQNFLRLKDHRAARLENPSTVLPRPRTAKAQLPPGAFTLFHACEFSDAA